MMQGIYLFKKVYWKVRVTNSEGHSIIFSKKGLFTRVFIGLREFERNTGDWLDNNAIPEGFEKTAIL